MQNMNKKKWLNVSKRKSSDCFSDMRNVSKKVYSKFMTKVLGFCCFCAKILYLKHAHRVAY